MKSKRIEKIKGMPERDYDNWILELYQKLNELIDTLNDLTAWREGMDIWHTAMTSDAPSENTRSSQIPSTSDDALRDKISLWFEAGVRRAGGTVKAGTAYRFADRIIELVRKG